jgi:hypothetical protein
VLFFAGAPFSLLAQSLISPATVLAPNAIERLVPVYSPIDTSAVPAAAVSHPAKTAHSLDASMDFEADINAAVNTQVLAKAPRRHLADFAMNLRDIRYRRGGHEPSTGFDCSGFVHYVYRQTFGLDLPFDAPGQFVRGEQIVRDELRTGDLVFFHEGKRITHVGIYLDDGRFIHSPRPGKRVRVDRLDSTYWAKRFAGAKRPSGLS